MNPKRTKRIQTVISPEHHDLLTELTKSHGKMNHIIEQGIEHVYQNKTGVHTCDASKTLEIQEQMIQNGYIFFDRKFIENLIENLINGTLFDWLQEYQKTNIEAGNPLLTIIDAENTFQGLLEYLQLESDYFKLYNIKFYDENNSSITLLPLLFPNYPEITATILCRTLDFLKYKFNVEILNNQILIYYIEKDNAKDVDERNKDIRKRYENLWSKISPTGYYRNNLLLESSNIPSQINFQKNIIENLNYYKTYAWERGSVIVEEKKSIILPQKSLIRILNSITNDEGKRTEIIGILSKSMFENLHSKNLQNISFSSFVEELSDSWSIWGFGQLKLQNEIDKSIKLVNNFVDIDWLVQLIDSLFISINYKIISSKLNNTFQDTLTLYFESLAKKILIVDDEQDIIDALIRDIRKIDKKIAVKSTTTPNNAIILLEKEKFNIILIDQKMKKMTGIEVLELIKDKYPSMRRILITGHGDTEIMKDAINRANINYFINKPWKRIDIENALN